MGPYSSAVIILVAFACNSICAPVSSAGDAGAADAESISTSTTTATEVALRGLANAVTLTGIETNQAAYIILNFLVRLLAVGIGILVAVVRLLAVGNRNTGSCSEITI